MLDEMKAFVILGRFGDIVAVLPAFRHIHETTGKKPRVVTSQQFGDIFDGVSYVDGCG